ncbi:MAG TPA: cupredoxin domain-containing protein [Vicinamibacterales bacterium]|nr:cupredoxin domain-containing protein [Vicinamibacterales bacterium]
MHVDLYERIWMWAAAVLLAVFLGAIFITAGAQAIHPPSHVETVDPTAIATHPEFGDPVVTTRPDGSVVVPVVALMFGFSPDPIEVPANVPVTFRITSADVIHGFGVVGTNANAMAIPGYVSQFTVTFTKPGEYPIACNEYCGLLHHAMVGKLIVR